MAAIGAQQHGVVTLTQLKDAGLTPTQVRDRLRKGVLHRIHRGVFAVGHPGISDRGRWMAAVLAAGRGSALSHRPAAELHTLLPVQTRIIDVTVPGRGGRRQRAGLRIHRSSLPRTDITMRDRVPVTAPARTLADLKRVVASHVYRRAVRQAEYLGLPLGDIPTDRTRSELERDFLRLCRRHRLPEPEVNVPVGPFTVDFLWRAARLVVEVDGWAAHRGHQAFKDDGARDLELHRSGYQVRRFEQDQLDSRPEAIATVIRSALGIRAITY